MKKSKKYMSDENFNRLVEAMNQAIEYERGERDDLRVTVLAKPNSPESRVVRSKLLLKQKLALEVADLSETNLKQITDFAAFLKSQEQSNVETIKK